MQFLYFLRLKIQSADPGQKKRSHFFSRDFLIFTFFASGFSVFCFYSVPVVPVFPHFPIFPSSPPLFPFFLFPLIPYFPYWSFKIYTIYIPEKRSLKITRDLWVVDSATGGLYGPFFWPGQALWIFSLKKWRNCISNEIWP